MTQEPIKRIPWNKGIPHSQETKEKIRLAITGKTHSLETRLKMSEARRGEKHPLFGKHRSEETKNILRNKNLGRVYTEDRNKKLSNSQKKRCHDPRVRQRMSESAKISATRPEVRKKYSEAGKRRYSDPNERKKQSDKLKNRIFTPEHRKKLSLAETGEKNHRFGKQRSEYQTLAVMEAIMGGFWYGNVKYKDVKYCELWNNEFRERVRAFFNYICVECKTPQNGIKLHVHHINYDKKTCCKKGEGVKDRKFVPLCRSCHAKTNHNRKYWQDHFSQIIDNYFCGKCYFTKEEFAEIKP